MPPAREQAEVGRREVWEKRAHRVQALAPRPGRTLDFGAGFGDFLVER